MQVGTDHFRLPRILSGGMISVDRRRVIELMHVLPIAVRLLIALAVTLPFLCASLLAGDGIPGNPYIFLIPAILINSVFLRWEAGTLALFAGAGFADWFFLPPFGPGISDSLHFFSMAVYTVVGAYMILMVAALQSSVSQIAAALAEAQAARDQSARSERDKNVVVEELHHRVKNALATVSSIARQTANSSASVAEFEESFQARLSALGKTHDAIAKGGWDSGARLSDVIGAELTPFGDRVTVQGEASDVVVGPGVALSLGLLFHELVTNAAKYGGLSEHGGGLVMSRRVVGRDLVVAWKERAPADPEAPRRKGFGTKLVAHSIGALGGEMERELEADGMRILMKIPLAALRGDA